MATTAPLVWVDGALIRAEEAVVPLMGHAVQRGSLVFDVGSFHPTPRGAALFRAPEHARRFLRSAALVGLEGRFDEAALVEAAALVVRENRLDADGLVRWSILYAAPEPDLLPRDRAVRVAVAAFVLQDPPRREPIRVAVFDDARKAAPDVISPEVKAAGVYLGPILARQRAARAGADEVVLLDQRGDLAEAPAANVFAVIGGALVTPPLTHVLPGITRRSVLELARREGIPAREERLTREAFAAADEAFLTSTSLPVASIGWVNDRAMKGAPGPITTRIFDLVSAAQHGAGPEEWLRLTAAG